MGAFDKFNAAGVYDEDEPSFTAEELEAAFDLRQRVRPDPRLGRTDQCPHTPICGALKGGDLAGEDLKDCIEAIAWYRRHQHAIEAVDKARV